MDLPKCNPVEAALSGDEVFETKDEFLSNSRLSSVPVAMRARELGVRRTKGLKNSWVVVVP